jgi:uncharacterized protein (TIGR03492 family)
MHHFRSICRSNRGSIFQTTTPEKSYPLLIKPRSPAKPNKMKLLCLSNGHGEDGIGAKIALQLQQLVPSAGHSAQYSVKHSAQISGQIMALPMVGLGQAYTQAGFPLLLPGQVMPSGGFLNMDSKELLRDLRQGLLPLAWQQLNYCRAWARAGGKILAVGDIVPLLFAWLSGGEYAFVGTAKSDYYRQSDELFGGQFEGAGESDYFPWERWLMSRRRCWGIFPRDTPTTQTLQKLGIRAFDLGNPMMDDLDNLDNLDGRWDRGDIGLATLASQGEYALKILLLPGSRPPEAYANWQVLLQGVTSFLQALPYAPELLAQHQRQVVFWAAIDPRLAPKLLIPALLASGWVPGGLSLAESDAEAQTWQLRQPLAGVQTRLHLLPAGFDRYAPQANLALAMAGTATEQFAGLGKPVITIPGQGPQFSQVFAQRQTRLLGPSVTLVNQAAAVGAVACELLQDPVRLAAIRVNGQARMGSSGAAARIATQLLNLGWQD